MASTHVNYTASSPLGSQVKSCVTTAMQLKLQLERLNNLIVSISGNPADYTQIEPLLGMTSGQGLGAALVTALQPLYTAVTGLTNLGDIDQP